MLSVKATRPSHQTLGEFGGGWRSCLRPSRKSRRACRGCLIRCRSVRDLHPEYRVGTASWTAPTLLAAGFYPPAAKSAEARLRFYAEHFNTVEIDSTYYALPSERNAALWAWRARAGATRRVGSLVYEQQWRTVG